MWRRHLSWVSYILCSNQNAVILFTLIIVFFFPVSHSDTYYVFSLMRDYFLPEALYYLNKPSRHWMGKKDSCCSYFKVRIWDALTGSDLPKIKQYFFLRAHLGEENFQVPICKSRDHPVHTSFDVSHTLYVQTVSCASHFF